MTNEPDCYGIEFMEIIQTNFDHLLWENPLGEARKDALRLDERPFPEALIVAYIFRCRFNGR